MSTQHSDPIENAQAVRPDPARSAHEDYEVHYSHEMSQETSAASGRLLLRTVPLLYGVLLGGLLDNLMLGVVLGAVVSAILDIAVCDRSFLRPLLRV